MSYPFPILERLADWFRNPKKLAHIHPKPITAPLESIPGHQAANEAASKHANWRVGHADEAPAPSSAPDPASDKPHPK